MHVPAFKQDTRTLSNCISRLVPCRQTEAPESRISPRRKQSQRYAARLREILSEVDIPLSSRDMARERGNVAIERMNSSLDPPRASPLVPQLPKEKKGASKRAGEKRGEGNVTTSYRSFAKRYDWQKFRLARTLARLVKS